VRPQKPPTEKAFDLVEKDVVQAIAQDTIGAAAELLPPRLMALAPLDRIFWGHELLQACPFVRPIMISTRLSHARIEVGQIWRGGAQ
jgi:hypothetical protein